MLTAEACSSPASRLRPMGKALLEHDHGRGRIPVERGDARGACELPFRQFNPTAVLQTGHMPAVLTNHRTFDSGAGLSLQGVAGSPYGCTVDPLNEKLLPRAHVITLKCYFSRLGISEIYYINDH